ncbi:MAG TPA: GNAT family protein [Bacteroidota bacterium]|nr:GNAT family protein [Bacteroidota bacterium]
MKAPEFLESARLAYRRPAAADAAEIFARYAADPQVTRYAGFRSHASLEDTIAFTGWSDAEWERWPAGPYLIRRRGDNLLVGSTGLAFETPYRAATGYVLATDAWGLGYATEALRAMAALAPTLGVRRLYAVCHTVHEKSSHVLEKGGFAREGILRSYMEFPNLDAGGPSDVFCYSMVF